MDMMIRNVKLVELNISIADDLIEIDDLKMI